MKGEDMPDLGTTPADTGKIAPVAPAGQAKIEGDAHSQTFQVPEKYKGKSAEELAKMHMELEKKLGEQSSEVSEARKKVDDAMKLQTDAVKARQTLQELTELIYADPERIKAVENWYAKKGQPANQTSQDNATLPGNSSPTSQTQPMVEDTRRALQDQIFDEFYARTGIDKLPVKEKQEALQKISSEFADLFDPTGRKTISQIVTERPLASLRRDLQKAYKLSDLVQVENTQSALAQEQNNQAAIGSLS
jgi:AraC-like DNA-binding protein